MGLFSSIASFMGAKGKKKAAGKAADAQIAAAQQGIDTVTAQNATGQAGIQEALAQLLPFITGGQEAFGAQGDLLGLGGDEAQAASIAALKGSPLFESLYRTGQETMLQNNSATGGLRGGNIQRSLADFGGDTLAKVIQNQLSNLSGMSTQGLSAAGTGAQGALGGAALGADAAQLIAQLFGGQGAAKAGGILGKANAKSDMWGAAMAGLGDIAAAFLPMPGGAGMGSKIAGLI